MTFAESVTILMRMLGYKEEDAGALWPEGYIKKAAAIGLTKGLSADAYSPVTRAQTAALFCNMLRTGMKEGGAAFVTSVSGSAIENTVLLSVTATAEDGSLNAVKTAGGTYKTAGGAAPATLLGKKGTLVLDKNGRAMTFLPDPAVSQKSVMASYAESNQIVTSAGDEISVLSSSVVYINDEMSTFEDAWPDIRAGMQVSIYYNSGGGIDFIYINSFSSDDVMVAKNPTGVNPFSAITGSGNDYKIYKNGILSSEADIRKFDVASYDSASKVLSISDDRLTAVYENAYPNTQTPERITVMGREFRVLPCAISDLSGFKIGNALTLLLTADSRVAGAVSPGVLSSPPVGTVEQADSSSVTVRMLNGLTFSTGTDKDYSGMIGFLVTINPYSTGKVSVTKIKAGSAYADLDVGNKKLGDAALSSNIIILDQVGGRAPVKVSLDDIATDRVLAGRIVYASKDYAGRVTALVLDDVTGDCYEYGKAVYDPKGFETVDPWDADNVSYIATVAVTNGGGTSDAYRTMQGFQTGKYYGIIGGSDGLLKKRVELKTIQNVPPRRF